MRPFRRISGPRRSDQDRIDDRALYSYDPFAVPRLTGAGSSWPFLYQGMEHEITDPAPLYFDKDANVYNPMLQRELSQLGQQGIAGPPTAGAGDGDMGNGFGGFGPSQGFGNPGGLSGGRIASNLLTVASAYLGVNSPIGFDLGGGESPIPIPILGGTVGGFLQWLGVGGGSDHSLPRQMQKGRHYIWPVVGINQSLTPTQKIADVDCPPQQRRFFANYHIYANMAKTLHTDVNFLIALSAEETGWLNGSHFKHHELFGLDSEAGTKIRSYPSFQACADDWSTRFGNDVAGSRNIDAFLSNLPYGSRDPGWHESVKRVYQHLGPWLKRCL